MKIKAVFLVCLFQAAAAAGENKAGPLPPGLGEAVTRAVVLPGVQAAAAAARNAEEGARAASKAYGRLFSQLRERSARRGAPDLALVRVCLKLTMRVNNGSLKTLSGYKAYPAEKDFERYAAAGRARIKAFSDGLGKDHAWGEPDNKRVQDILMLELKKGIAMLPLYRGAGVPMPPAPTPEEQEYFEAK